MARLVGLLGSLAVVSAARVGSTIARVGAVPTTCGKFSVTGDDAQTCAVTLTEGFTYSMYTSCATVKGLPVLRLLDDAGVEVAYNDGFPFCAGNVTAALVEFFMPCFSYPTAVAEFALSTECVGDSSCSGDLEVVLSTKVIPEDCPRLRPMPPSPPPAKPAAPAPPGSAYCPAGKGGNTCYPTANYTFGCCPYPPQPGSAADPTESTCAMTAEHTAACIFGDSCALGVPCTTSADCAAKPGYIPSCVIDSCCAPEGTAGGFCFPITDQCAPPPTKGQTSFRKNVVGK